MYPNFRQTQRRGTLEKAKSVDTSLPYYPLPFLLEDKPSRHKTHTTENFDFDNHKPPVEVKTKNPPNKVGRVSAPAGRRSFE